MTPDKVFISIISAITIATIGHIILIEYELYNVQRQHLIRSTVEDLPKGKESQLSTN